MNDIKSHCDCGTRRYMAGGRWICPACAIKMLDREAAYYRRMARLYAVLGTLFSVSAGLFVGYAVYLAIDFFFR